MAYAATGRRRAAAVALAIEVMLAGAAVALARSRPPDLGPDYVAIENVPAGPAEPAVGSFSWECGRNEGGHRNTANIVVSPTSPGSPHHVHDYLGNLSVRIGSTVAGLAGQPTSCTNGDQSTYYWPVLRTVTGAHGGEIQVPESVTMTYLGNPYSPVVESPRRLRGVVGDAYAETNGGTRAAAVWSCEGSPRRRTTSYPICPDGRRVVRTFDFPSCWDGRRVDSKDHRQHLLFPAPGGGCPISTFAVPRLKIVMAYDLPPGARYRIDAFEPQRHSPRTDHGFFVNLMPQKLMAGVARCLNAAANCQDPGLE
ncbi:MAG: DUF1996 domain-containing protein [Actinoplanes sp.]